MAPSDDHNDSVLSACDNDDDDDGDDDGGDADQISNPVQHVFFLKIPKTGSQTLTGILNRYALTHNLTVALRIRTDGHEARWTRNWTSSVIRPLPPGISHYDMITDHVRFCEPCVWHFLPRDKGTVFISIVREPLDRFVSAFYFSKDVWLRYELTEIPGPDPLLTYLNDLERWDTSWGSLTHSTMAHDFGMDLQALRDHPRYLHNTLHHLSQVFHLVMLTEAFDESLVLLKRILSWKLRDMLYVKLNVGNTRRPHNFTHKQKNEFKKRREEEYAIYEHFRSEFYKKLRAQDDSFVEEVQMFQNLRGKVEIFCQKIAKSEKRLELRVESTRFSERFRVTLEDCRLLLRESSSIRDLWFERLMLKRLQHWSHAK